MTAINMGMAQHTLDVIEDLLNEVDGQDPTDDEGLPGKDRREVRAERSVKLLRAAHEAKRLELQIMDQYHSTRAQNRA